MNYLAIDTSSEKLMVIASGDNGEYVIYEPDCAMRHSERLMTAVDQALTGAGLEKKDIDVFACNLGPGSFTGIRIGVSTVKGLAYALKKRVLGVTSFDVIAYNSDITRKLCTVDARHGYVYAAAFDGGRQVMQPSYVAENELKAEGFARLKWEECDAAAGLKRAVENKLGFASGDLESLVPLYIRKSQAEEGR